MNIERMSKDGLTHETWQFDTRRVDGVWQWVILGYERRTRTNKRNRTWKQVAFCSRWPHYHTGESLPEAPIDGWVIAELRRLIAEAPISGRLAP